MGVTGTGNIASMLVIQPTGHWSKEFCVLDIFSYFGYSILKHFWRQRFYRLYFLSFVNALFSTWLHMVLPSFVTTSTMWFLSLLSLRFIILPGQGLNSLHRYCIHIGYLKSIPMILPWWWGHESLHFFFLNFQG